MMDVRDVPVSYNNVTALERYEMALLNLHQFSYNPVPAIDGILKDYPDFAQAHIFRAVCFAGSAAARYVPAIERALVRAENVGNLNDRELKQLGLILSQKSPLSWANSGTSVSIITLNALGLITAVRSRCAGEWRQAQLDVDAVLARYPRDSLALFFGHQLDFLLGDALNLRGRIERLLPHWDESIPNYSHVLGMYAFGLEECNMFGEAESVGREACERDPDDAWAHHAVGHVIEMLGRHEDGINWYDGRKSNWATGDGLSIHNWWHLCLYLMEVENYPRILEIYDTYIAANGESDPEPLADSGALLWRLVLHGVDVGDRWVANGERWRELIAQGEGGVYGFNDLHAAFSFAGLGWDADLADLESRARTQAQQPHTLGTIARDVSMPVIQSIIAFHENRFEDSFNLLNAVRPVLLRFGGSNAQRDVVDQTMLVAAIRGGLRERAASLSNERLIRKPNGPLASRFAERARLGA